jgi:hypothetical protein
MEMAYVGGRYSVGDLYREGDGKPSRLPRHGRAQPEASAQPGFSDGEKERTPTTLLLCLNIAPL